MRWSVELSQYEICYLPRTTIKGQIVVDFIVEQKLSEGGGDAQLDLRPPARVALGPPPCRLTWDLYVDGSSNDGGSGAGLILLSLEPEFLKIEYPMHFGFKASNNDAEYKALLTRLRLAQVVRIRHLDIFSDS